MKSYIQAGLIVLAFFVPNGIAARTIVANEVLKGNFEPKEDSGYIFLHAPSRHIAFFLKEPDADDIEQYKTEWDQAFQKAKEKYPKKLTNWEKQRDRAKEAGKKFRKEKPVEPTPQTFSIGDLETRNRISIGPKYVFEKVKNEYYSYLNEVTPGTYIYYGPLYFEPELGFVGSCYCMGTIKFEVKPGQITNLGNFFAFNQTTRDLIGADGKPLQIPGTWVHIDVNRGTDDMKLSYALPKSLKNVQSAIPEYGAVGKMDNYFGVLIDRIPSIEGVLGYEQDRVIDLRATNENANPDLTDQDATIIYEAPMGGQK